MVHTLSMDVCLEEAPQNHKTCSKPYRAVSGCGCGIFQAPGCVASEASSASWSSAVPPRSSTTKAPSLPEWLASPVFATLGGECRVLPFVDGGKNTLLFVHGSWVMFFSKKTRDGDVWGALLLGGPKMHRSTNAVGEADHFCSVAGQT